jgi:hypothetical protein
MGRLLRLDPIVIVGIVISVALTVGVDMWGGASDAESLLAGLVGINITLALDGMVRAERRFHLRRHIESVEWLGSAIIPIMEHTKDIVERYPASPILVEAQQKFRELTTDLDNLRSGRIGRPGGDYEYLIGWANNCRTRLEAVTNILPGLAGSPDWWASEIGRRYWQANLMALNRGVLVSRVFIYAELTDGLRALAAAQSSAGVRVMLLARAAVDPAQHLNMAIFDNSTAWEARMNAHGEIVENLYYVADRDVERLRTVFRICELNAAHTDFDSSPIR